MDLYISLTGTSFFKKNLFSFPQPSGPLWTALVNIIFRKSAISSRQVASYSDSISLSDHVNNLQWNSAIRWIETEIFTQPDPGSFSRNFPVEVRLSSGSVHGYFQVKESKEYSFMKVDYSEVKKNHHVFYLEDK